jgi:hypothetical protein
MAQFRIMRTPIVEFHSLGSWVTRCAARGSAAGKQKHRKLMRAARRSGIPHKPENCSVTREEFRKPFTRSAP